MPAALHYRTRQLFFLASVNWIQHDLGEEAPVAHLISDANFACADSDAQAISRLFIHEVDRENLAGLARNRGGLPMLRVTGFPTPPGWKDPKSAVGFWVQFSTNQDIEEDHDRIFPVVSTANGLRLAAEVPEDRLFGWSIQKMELNSHVFPASHSVEVTANLDLNMGASSVAVPFRLAQKYKVKGSEDIAVSQYSPNLYLPKPSQLVHIGGLLMQWRKGSPSHLSFHYTGTVNTPGEDLINDHEAYVTAWWTPSLGRLPFPVESTITGPKTWEIRAEGIRTSAESKGDEQTVHYHCPLKISYPKIVGGNYSLMGTQTVGGNRFAIYQLSPTDPKLAARDLKATVAAAQFFTSTLGPLPFPGYESFDSDGYYGIESYSYTLLNRSITHFTSHEMGHSYFGGIVPCAYVNDSWNEGLTEYIDSVVLLHDADGSLEAGLRTIGVKRPLTDMPIAHDYEGTSYWRGCYVMKMLESEIGPKTVLAGLRRLVTERKGLPTTWNDIRKPFEEASGKELGWFWKQWVETSTFPHLQVTRTRLVGSGLKHYALVTVTQSGTAKPFRLKFEVVLSGEQRSGRLETMTKAVQTFRIPVSFVPSRADLKIFPYTLCWISK